MLKKPSSQERVTASAGESNGHTSCNTIPVAGKFPISKPQSGRTSGQDPRHQWEARMTCPERSRVIIACRPALPKFKIRWAVVQFPGCSLSSLTAGRRPQPRQVAEVPFGGLKAGPSSRKKCGPRRTELARDARPARRPRFSARGQLRAGQGASNQARGCSISIGFQNAS